MHWTSMQVEFLGWKKRNTEEIIFEQKITFSEVKLNALFNSVHYKVNTVALSKMFILP